MAKASIKPYYEEPGITIYHGDCRDILPHLEPVDLVLTSPPFNAGKEYELNTWPTLSAYLNWLSGSIRLVRGICNLGAWVICEVQDLHVSPEHSHSIPGQKEQFNMATSSHLTLALLEEGLYFKGEAIWDRGRWINNMAGKMACAPGSPALLVQHSKVLFFRNPGGRTGAYHWSEQSKEWKREWCRTIWSHIQPQHNRGHPAIMPLKMARGIIQGWSLPNSIILDPFMGSGTTLRAAKDLGRKAIGIEIEKKYCEIAVRRLRQEVLKFG